MVFFSNIYFLTNSNLEYEKISISNAISKMLQIIYNSRDNGFTVLSLFHDFSKAFDWVVQKIILHKLKAFSVQGFVLTWFQSCFSDRVQNVSINGNVSDILPGFIFRTCTIFYLHERFSEKIQFLSI